MSEISENSRALSVPEVRSRTMAGTLTATQPPPNACTARAPSIHGRLGDATTSRQPATKMASPPNTTGRRPSRPTAGRPRAGRRPARTRRPTASGRRRPDAVDLRVRAGRGPSHEQPAVRPPGPPAGGVRRTRHLRRRLPDGGGIAEPAVDDGGPHHAGVGPRVVGGRRALSTMVRDRTSGTGRVAVLTDLTHDVPGAGAGAERRFAASGRCRLARHLRIPRRLRVAGGAAPGAAAVQKQRAGLCPAAAAEAAPSSANYRHVLTHGRAMMLIVLRALVFGVLLRCTSPTRRFCCRAGLGLSNSGLFAVLALNVSLHGRPRSPSDASSPSRSWRWRCAFGPVAVAFLLAVTCSPFLRLLLVPGARHDRRRPWRLHPTSRRASRELPAARPPP